MQRAFKPSLIAASILLAVTTQQASATNGYAAHGFGMTQKAMGGTAVAGNDNAMNIATNPASMSFGKNNWTAGVDIFVPDRGASHPGRPGHPDIPLGAFFPPGTPLPPGAVVPADNGIAAASLRGNDDGNFPIPEFAYQKHLNSKFAVGVAVYGNGGMNATYDRPIFAGPGSKNTGIDFSQLFIAPSVSMKVGEGSSIGASLNLVYQRVTVNGISAFAPFSRAPSKLTDNDYDGSTGAGVSIGWQTQFSDAMTFGAAYRSKTAMSKFDKYSGLFAEQGDFDIPSMFTIGLSVKATPKTTLAFDVAHIKYTGVKSISNKNNTAGLQQQLVGQAFGLIPPGSPLQGSLLGDENGAGFGWDDQTILKLGVKHQFNNKIALMAGFNHGKSPIENDQTAFNILAPATVEDHLTLGMEYKLSKNSNLTFSYMHAFERKIEGNGSRGPGPFGPGTGAPLVPGAIIGIGGNPLTDFAAADVDMSQNSFGIAYSKNF